MKYKDLMEELAAHPEKTYQLGDWVAYMESGVFTLKNTRFGAKFESTFDDDWQLIRQAVTWQEALRAWADGRVVSVYVPEGFESATRKKALGVLLQSMRYSKAGGIWRTKKMGFGLSSF